MNNHNFIAGLGAILIWLLAIGGWIANIVKLITTEATLAEFTVMEIARIVGIFIAPLGVVLGYF